MAIPSERIGPTVAAVTLNYKTPRNTIRTVQSFLATRPNDVAIIIENGSGDGSIDVLRNAFGNDRRVIIVDTGRNLGFSGGNNRGLEVAHEIGAAYVLFQSSDATVEEECVNRLLDTAKRFDAWAVQPLILEEATGAVDTAGHEMLKSGFVVDSSRGQPPDSRFPTHPVEVFGVCAAVALYPLERLRGLGGLDDRLFIYYEDVDLSFRIRLAGGLALLDPSARAVHIRAATSSSFSLRAYYQYRNSLCLLLKFYPLSWIVGPLRLEFLSRTKSTALQAIRHRKILETCKVLVRGLLMHPNLSTRAVASIFKEWPGVRWREPLFAAGSQVGSQRVGSVTGGGAPAALRESRRQ